MEKLFEVGVSDNNSESVEEPVLSRRSFLKGGLAAAGVLAFENVVPEKIFAQEQGESSESKELKELMNDTAVAINGYYEDGQRFFVLDKDVKMDDLQSMLENVKALINHGVVDIQTGTCVTEIAQAFKAKNQEKFDQGIADLKLHWAQNGYFFNMRNYLTGGKPIKEAAYREITLSENSGLSDVFSEDIDDLRFPIVFFDDVDCNIQGFTADELIAVNIAEIKREFTAKLQDVIPQNDTWESFDNNSFLELTLYNEITHYILEKKYNIQLHGEHSIDITIDEGESLSVSNEQINEFISDAGSISIDPRFILFKIRHVLISKIAEQSSNVEASVAENYVFSTSFTEEVLQEIAQKKGLSFFAEKSIKDVSQEIDDQVEKQDRIKIYDEFHNKQMMAVLQNLSSDDLKYIRKKFVDTARLATAQLAKQ